MSRIRANNIVNGAGTGAPTFPNGAVINGITTITADVSTTGSNLTIGTGTTISNPDDDQFRILTNGSERLRIDSNGKIAFGNYTPTYDLDLLRTTSGVGATMRVGATAASGINTASVIINNGGTGNAVLDFKYESAATPRASIYVYRSDQELRFDTAGSEAARFTSAGNLKFPSGQGIDFSATGDGSGTTTSELLDDYEEGTYTPSISSGTGTITLNTSYDTLTYEKIGNCCHVHGRVRLSSVSSPTGNVLITLPFSRNDGTEDEGRIGGVVIVQNAAGSINSYGLHPHDGSFMQIGRIDTSAFDNSIADEFSGDELIYFNVTYRTS